MTDLEKLQGLFQAAVMAEKTAFLAEIDGGGKIPPARRLHIYQHAYKARLRDVLAEDFPVLHGMLGDEAFDELCQRYIVAYPSSHSSLRYFGQNLEKFVTGESPYNTQVVIGEMARFEWNFHDVFDAPDHAAITIEDVGALVPAVWTTLRFEFHPSLHIAPYDWNVLAVWSSVQEENTPSTNSETVPDIMPEVLNETTYAIQWRQDLRSYFRSLAPDEARALLMAMDNKAFPEICEGLAFEHADNAPVRAAELLRNWVTEGLISSLNHMDMGPQSQ